MAILSLSLVWLDCHTLSQSLDMTLVAWMFPVYSVMLSIGLVRNLPHLATEIPSLVSAVIVVKFVYHFSNNLLHLSCNSSLKIALLPNDSVRTFGNITELSLSLPCLQMKTIQSTVVDFNLCSENLESCFITVVLYCQVLDAHQSMPSFIFTTLNLPSRSILP